MSCYCFGFSIQILLQIHGWEIMALILQGITDGPDCDLPVHNNCRCMWWHHSTFLPEMICLKWLSNDVSQCNYRKESICFLIWMLEMNLKNIWLQSIYRLHFNQLSLLHLFQASDNPCFIFAVAFFSYLISGLC